jgi:hypothetical protein
MRRDSSKINMKPKATPTPMCIFISVWGLASAEDVGVGELDEDVELL